MAAQLDAVRSSTEVTEETRTQLITNLTQSQQEVASIAQWNDAAKRYETMISSAAAEADRIARELNQSLAPQPALPPDPTREDLEKRKVELETAITEATAERDRLQAEPSRRQQRLTDIPTTSSSLREEQTRLRSRLAEPPPAGEAAIVSSTRVQTTQVRLAVIAAQLKALELESQAYAATSQLLPRQQELASKKLANLEARKREIDERLRRIIAEDSAEQVKAAQAAAENTLPELRTLANEVVQLLRDNESEQSEIEQLSRTLDRIEEKKELIKNDLEYIRKRLDTVGLTTGFGALLRSKRSEVLRIRTDYDPSLSDQEELRATQLRIFEVQEDRQKLLADADFRESLIDTIIRAHPNRSPDSVADEVDWWMRRKLDELAKLEATCQTHFERWVTVDSQRHELRDRCDEFIRYVEERVLWVRSSEPLRLRSPALVLVDLRRLLAWGRWAESVPRVAGDLQANLLFGPLLVGLLLVIAVYRSKLRAVVIDQGKLAAKKSCQAFRPTGLAFLASMLLGSLWPLLLSLIGWRMMTPTDPSGLLDSLGSALLHTAWFLWPIEIVRQLTRPDGLGEHHFSWPADARSMLRRVTRIYSVGAPILFFIAQAFYLLDEHARLDQEWNNEAGRIAFLFLLGLSFLFAFRILHPTQGVMAHLEADHRKSLWYRARYLLTFSVLGGLLAMIVLSSLGYYYSGLQLAYRVFQSLSFLLLVAVISALLRRWLFIRRRRLAMKQYRDRLEALRSRSDAPRSANEAFAVELPSETEVDLAALSQQTRQLIHFVVVLVATLGVLAIWADMLPALGVFGQMKVWDVSQGGQVVTITIEKLTRATLTLLVMIVAVKNLPALLEIMLLQHLPIDSGARYAITTITRYVILLVGSVVALSTIGIEWAQYSWLVAAATVGLGFGLQEIFANFISGLIMLLERPCKVGDVVTVDGVTGIVTRIQMRATTVTNWDHQDLIVPNKEFVTGKLLNWTLGNSINRVVIQVGVAYGSDTNLVTQLLGKIASEHPEVMKEPTPNVTFEAFGASTLDFVLRCFLPSLERRLATIHELHSEIDRVFREAGIEIAFPQQDLHLRTVDAKVLGSLGRESGIGSAPLDEAKGTLTSPDGVTASDADAVTDANSRKVDEGLA
ncbi:MAG: mechanosensitive ion channel [Planctomycetales bacterium]|nr:mechanosensitive ion channel [Planctomycetales bacterium]